METGWSKVAQWMVDRDSSSEFAIQFTIKKEGECQMYSLVLLSILIAVATVSAGGLFAAPTQPTVGPKMLMEGGDVLNDEILAFQRLRAERRTVIENDDSIHRVQNQSSGGYTWSAVPGS